MGYKSEQKDESEAEKISNKPNLSEAKKEGYSSPISSTSYYSIDNLNTETARPSANNGQTSQSEMMLKNALNTMNQVPNEYSVQNGQSQKVAFLKKMKRNDGFTLSSRLEKPISPYSLTAGKAIDATLKTGISSDLPGQIIAVVSRDIYDSVYGNHLLIPQGTEILGEYSSQISYGQDRVLMAWTRLSFPNGDKFDLQGMPGVDLAGLAGLADKVDNHTTKIFGSALAFSVFGALGQLSQPRQAANTQPTNSQIIYGAIGQEMTQTAAKMVEKNMNIQPTITIRPGTRFKILITKDMIFPSPYQYN
jgi:type IV secretion system protein VirB10